MHEVITLQFGNFSNFVGTHFWNAQEDYFTYSDATDTREPEVSHDILFREGKSPQGAETYTPRLLIYDLKGCFGSLKKYNRLFEESENVKGSIWDTVKYERHVQPSYEKNGYLLHLDQEQEGTASESLDYMGIESASSHFLLDETVEFWSDYNRMYYHPRSINELSSYQCDNDFTPFDVFTYGQDAFTKFEQEADSFDNNLRFFAEECDSIQGFHVTTSALDGWGGFTANYLERLQEEFPKAPVMTYGFCEGQSRLPIQERSQKKRWLNSLLCISDLSELSSLYIPLQVPQEGDLDPRGWSKYLRCNLGLRYHTSAIMAAGLETTTLPYRLKKRIFNMFNFCSTLNWRGNTPLTSLSMSLPFSAPLGESTGSSLCDTISQSLHDFTVVYPYKKETTYSHSLVLRGIAQSALAQGESTLQKKLPEMADTIFDQFQVMTPMANMRTFTELAYPIPDSHPQFFSSVNEQGHFLPGEPSNRRVKCVPILSRLQTSTGIRRILQDHSRVASELNFKQFPEYGEGDKGLGVDDFDRAKNMLLDLYDIYNET